MRPDQLTNAIGIEKTDLRVFKWRLRCVVRVNLAGQRGHSFVWGSVGMLPLWERILESAFVRATDAAGNAVDDDASSDATSGGTAGPGSGAGACAACAG